MSQTQIPKSRVRQNGHQATTHADVHTVHQEWQPGPPATGGGLLRALLKAMRPKQWLKNGLLFFAPVAALKIGDFGLMSTAAAAAVIFIFVSSAIYLINDIVDVNVDRRHPRKRNRPIASGKLPIPLARIVAALFLLVTVPLGFYLGPTLTFGLIVVAYIGNALLYDFFFKHIVLVDLFSLAAGFVLRVMAGAVVTGVSISPWLYLVTLLGALFIGVNKRRHELVLLEQGAGKHRPILDEYSPQLLDQFTSALTAGLIIAYSLYTWQGETVSKKNNLMMITIPFAIFAIFRYLYLIYQKDEGGAPEELLTRDGWLIACVLLWGATVVTVLYFFKDVVIHL